MAHHHHHHHHHHHQHQQMQERQLHQQPDGAAPRGNGGQTQMNHHHHHHHHHHAHEHHHAHSTRHSMQSKVPRTSASALPPRSVAGSYSAVLHEAIGIHFADVVAEKHPEVATLLRAKLEACRQSDLTGRVVDPAFHQHMEQNILPSDATWSSEPSKDEGEISASMLLAEMDAKLVDVQRRARKYAGIAVTDAVARTGRVHLGDTFDELIERFCRANAAPAKVQELLKFANVWPSFTTHPTNPLSFAYTAVCTELDEVIGDRNTSPEKLKSLLRRVRDTSIEFDRDPAVPEKLLAKKTPELEIEELSLFLDVAYRSIVGPHRRLRAALDRFGYATVAIESPLANMCVWGAGDGDGNPNMTDASLRHQLAILGSRIRANYVADLRKCSGLKHLADSRSEVNTVVGAIAEAFQSGTAAEAAALVTRLEQLERLLQSFVPDTAGRNSSAASAGGCGCGCATDPATETSQLHTAACAALGTVEALLIKVRAFGLHFAKTDVRHNSVDIMETAGDLLGAFDALPAGATPADFKSWPSKKQSELLRALLVGQEGATLGDKISAVSSDALRAKLEAKEATTAARVFLRMRVMAQFPSAFEKLIIAETRTASNGLAALLLLKLAGNAVATPGATLSVVPLFESRQDLADAPRTFHELATDPVFRAHLDEVGHFIAMIAKSDTTRLSGAGVLGRQEDTVARLMAMNHASYGGSFKMHIFVGGGDDQMRGGGRIVETPHVLSIAARRMYATEPSRFAMTIQGMQMQITYGSPAEAEYFVEAFASQQCLAAARIRAVLPYRKTTTGVNTSAARTEVQDFFNAAMDGYEEHVGNPDGTAAQKHRRATMVAYLNGFPSAIVTSGNKSSRPMSRKKTQDPLQGRAISLDQLAKHDGAYMTATLGVAAAFRMLESCMFYGAPEFSDDVGSTGTPLSPIRHAYLANKTFRDFVRMQAVVLAQKDYSVAWTRRGGPPLNDKERQALVAEYKAGGAASPRALLAFAQAEDAYEARVLVEAITGHRPDSCSPVPMDVPLRLGWPHLARAMALRSRNSALAQAIETRAAMRLATAPDDAVALRMGYFGYVGANPQFSTPNFSLTMTDPVKEAAAAKVVNSDDVARRLKWPLWAAAVAAEKTFKSKL